MSLALLPMMVESIFGSYLSCTFVAPAVWIYKRVHLMCNLPLLWFYANMFINILAARDASSVRIFSVHVEESIEEQYWKGDERGQAMSSRVQVERLRLLVYLLGQVTGISPSWDHVIWGTVADGAGSAEVNGPPGGLLFTAHFVDVG